MNVDFKLIEECHRQRQLYADIVQAWIHAGIEFVECPSPVNSAMYRMRHAQARRAEADIANADAALLRSFGLGGVSELRAETAEPLLAKLSGDMP